MVRRCPEHPDVDLGEPAPFATPPSIPGFTEIAFLGGGGFADVFRARAGDGSYVAIKIARRPGDDRFALEAAALERAGGARLGPALYGHARTVDHRSYLVMELLPGASLASWLEQQPAAAPPLDHAVATVRAIATTVDQLHAIGIVHGDLKPENLIWTEHGLAVIDFGIARTRQQLVDAKVARLSGVAHEATRAGTVSYMAPEQCKGELFDERADLYATGIMIFELLVGRIPFIGDASTVEAAQVSQRPPRASELAALPSAVDDVLARALAKDPAARFTSAAAMVAAIEIALAAKPAARPIDRAASERDLVPATTAQKQVVLLALSGSGASRAIGDAAPGAGALVARSRGPISILAFASELSLEAGVRAALRFARRIGNGVEGAIVHVAPVRIRASAGRTQGGPADKSGGTIVIGNALERFDAWPTPTGREPFLTPEAADVLDPRATTTTSVSGYLVAVDDDDVPAAPRGPLRGRDDSIAFLDELSDGCVRNAHPLLVTIAGDVGYGKSRVLEELGARLAAFDVVRVTGRNPETHSPDELLRDLWSTAFMIDRPSAVDYLARMESAMQAPGAWRLTVARAISEALHRRATRKPLALLVDDAHLADQISLDTFELATIEGARVPLLLCVSIRPHFFKSRPRWGDRAEVSTVRELSMLDADASRAMLMDLLKPVEYIPDEVLARLCTLAGGVPMQLVQLAHALRVGGAMRRHARTESWYLATDEVPNHSSTPLAERLAGQLVAGMPPALQALARLCAVLGDSIVPTDLEGVERLLDPEDRSNFDAAVGVQRLVEHGVLRATHEQTYAFVVQREAFEHAIPDAMRVRLHDAARRHLAGSINVRLARHAAACGARDEAARTYLHLAKLASARHLYVEAEAHYTAALRYLGDRDAPPRQQALTGRAKVRYRLWRNEDALADLRGALAIAEQRNDEPAIVDLLLEEGTLLDWSFDFENSALAVAAATDRAKNLFDPVLDARCTFSIGRTHWRAERLDQAIETLTDARARAVELDHYETRVLSSILLAPALVYANREAEAEACFAETLASCEKLGDRIHSGVLYTNRMTLWMKRQDYARATDDARNAVILAREIGHPQIERVAQYNVAELLYWLGAPDSAIGHALRSRKLQLSTHEKPGPEDSLLCARIHAALAHYDLVRELVGWIASNTDAAMLAPSQQALLSMIELVVTRTTDAAAWEQVVATARTHSLLDERVEILFACATNVESKARRRYIDEAMTAIASAPTWRARFASLV